MNYCMDHCRRRKISQRFQISQKFANIHNHPNHKILQILQLVHSALPYLYTTTVVVGASCYRSGWGAILNAHCKYRAERSNGATGGSLWAEDLEHCTQKTRTYAGPRPSEGRDPYSTAHTFLPALPSPSHCFGPLP